MFTFHVWKYRILWWERRIMVYCEFYVYHGWGSCLWQLCTEVSPRSFVHTNTWTLHLSQRLECTELPVVQILPPLWVQESTKQDNLHRETFTLPPATYDPTHQAANLEITHSFSWGTRGAVLRVCVSFLIHKLNGPLADVALRHHMYYIVHHNWLATRQGLQWLQSCWHKFPRRVLCS